MLLVGLILISWLTIMWWVVKLLGPVIAEFLGAQLAEFKKRNPAWSNVPEKGLALLKDLGLAAISLTSGYSFPENVSEDVRNETLRNEAIRILGDLAREEMLHVGENEIRRTVEESVTAWKQGMRPTERVQVTLAKVMGTTAKV